MDYQNKTKEDIVFELQKLQNDYDSLKLSNSILLSRLNRVDLALFESEQYFYHAFEYSAISMCMVNIDGRFIKVNNAFEKLFGYNKDEIISMNFNDITHPDDSSIGLKFLNSLLKDEIDTATFDKRYIHKNGNVLFVSISVSIIKINEKEPFFISQIFDITEKKIAEDNLKKSKESYKQLSKQFEAILDHLPALVFYKDKKNNFIRVNKYMAEAYKKNKRELEGINLITLYEEKVANEYFRDDLEVINSGIARLNIEEKWETAEGLKWVNTSKIPFVDDTGEILGIIGISTDITERKQAEILILQKNKELQELNQTKDKFFSIIAHDLKGPFSVLIGISDLIIDKIDSYDKQKVKSLITSLNLAANNTFKLLQNLLEWSQLQRGKIKPELMEFNLRDILNSASSLFSDMAKNKKILFQNNVTSDFLVHCDLNMTNTIIRNMVSNAIKFTMDQGVVIVSAKQDGQFVEIQVKDEGVGIPPENIPYLFSIEKNISTRGTKDEKGTGLGLLLCKELVKKQGGTIWAESIVGKGSTFYFTLRKPN
jgi:PAS domain S-box-containing protein